MFAFRNTPAQPASQPAAAPPPRAYLNVPYAEKDEAKALGARWDNAKRQWYAPNAEPALVERWAAKPVVPLTALEGEVRDFGPTTLVVDFGPKSCWCKKIRYALTPDDFKRVEALVIGRTSRTCEACGVVDPEQADRMEVQARWEYDVSDGKHVQRLVRLMAMCSACHEVTHFGKASMDGRRDAALLHLQKAAQMTADNAQAHVDAAYDKLRELNQHEWQLDLSLLTDNGLTLAKPRTFSGPYVRRGSGGGGRGGGGSGAGGGRRPQGTTAGQLRRRGQQQAEAGEGDGGVTLSGFAFRG